MEQKNNVLQNIFDFYPDDEFLIADGFNDAVIGIDSGLDRLVYSSEKCVEILMERDGMSFDEAVEFFEYNVAGAYVGELTPIFVYCEWNETK